MTIIEFDNNMFDKVLCVKAFLDNVTRDTVSYVIP